MGTLREHELLQDLPRQSVCRGRYYRLESRISGIYDKARLQRLIDTIPHICKRLKLHHVHRSYLEKKIVAQFGAVDRRNREKARRRAEQMQQIFGANLRPNVRNVTKTEARLLELIELRATCGISALIDNCKYPYSHSWPYTNMFPRSHTDNLHVPRKLHNLIKTKIKEIEP